MSSLPDAVAVRSNHNNLFGPLNVLVVDDMPAIRRMLRQMLMHLGVQGAIQEAEDGQEAWETLQEQAYDLVVCDINMPRMNGLDLLRRLRTTPQYETTPFLMITGEVSEDIVAASVESEVDGYLLKPFKVDSLENRLRAIIRHRHQPSQGDFLFLQARKFLAGGRFNQALTVLEKLNRPPFRKQAKVLNLMGKCHQGLGSLEEAAACFIQALKINPKFLKAFQNLAVVLESQGKLAEAQRYLEEAQHLSPLNPARLYHLGQLCLKNGDCEKAKHYLLESWLKGHIVPPDQRPEVAETFLSAGLDQVAEELLLQAIEDTPHEASLYNRLGVTLRRQKKHRQAMEYYQKALKLDPKNKEVHFNLGVLYFDLKENGKALKAFQDALRLCPDFVEARNFLKRHFANQDVAAVKD